MRNPNRTRGRKGCPELRRLEGVNRRQVLQAGALGFLGLGLPGLLEERAAAEALRGTGGFGRARRCIFLFMWGGPSQLDTFDPKPDAPAEIRGEFKPIATNVPGLRIGEHFHRLAKIADKVAIVRSLTHDDPAHLSSAHTMLTGHLPPVNKSDAVPPSDNDTPHIGSVLARLREDGWAAPKRGQAPAETASLPPFVTMPWKCYHPAAPGGQAPGQHGGWLGHKYDPFLVTGDPSRPDWSVPALALTDGVTTGRLENRRRLLRTLDAQRRALDGTAAAFAMTAHQEKAFRLLAAPEVRTAFDLSREPDDTRDRYGRNIHGQCVLLARRLIEHGVPLVSVNWHDDGKTFWDTHGDNFNRLKNDLIPPADQALCALLEDLEQRGLLDETLVVWVGEFGRKPEITAGNAGREHWPFCYSGLLAGGGIRGGTVYGGSDKQAAYPAEKPVTPHDFSATLYHALGVPADATVNDRLDRPHRVCEGRPVTELFG